MKLGKICTLSLMASICLIFSPLNSLSAVTLQELLDQKSSLTARIDDLEVNKRSIAKRINEVVGIINANIKSETLNNQQIMELEREYNNLFKTIEKLSDEWIVLLCEIDDIVDEIDKMRADNKVDCMLHI